MPTVDIAAQKESENYFFCCLNIEKLFCLPEYEKLWGTIESSDLSTLTLTTLKDSEPIFYTVQETFPVFAVFISLAFKQGSPKAQTNVQKFCCKFCIILKVFWQHKRYFDGKNGPNFVATDLYTLFF